MWLSVKKSLILALGSICSVQGEWLLTDGLGIYDMVDVRQWFGAESESPCSHMTTPCSSEIETYCSSENDENNFGISYEQRVCLAHTSEVSIDCAEHLDSAPTVAEFCTDDIDLFCAMAGKYNVHDCLRQNLPLLQVDCEHYLLSHPQTDADSAYAYTYIHHGNSTFITFQDQESRAQAFPDLLTVDFIQEAEVGSVLDHMIDLSLSFLNTFFQQSTAETAAAMNNDEAFIFRLDLLNDEATENEYIVYDDDYEYESDTDYNVFWNLEESGSILKFSLREDDEDAPTLIRKNDPVVVESQQQKRHPLLNNVEQVDSKKRSSNLYSAKKHTSTKTKQHSKYKHDLRFFIAVLMLTLCFFMLFLTIITLINYIIRKLQQRRERMLFKQNFKPLLLETY